MRRGTIGVIIIIFLVLAGFSGAYLAIAMNYEDHFFEKTTINGIDVSDMTVKQAEEKIAEQAEKFHLTVETREGNQETITGDQIGYKFVSGGEVQSFLESQNFLLWVMPFFSKPYSYNMDAAVTYDENMLAATAASLSCMKEEQTVKPQDAYIKQQEDGTYVVIPEVQGNQVNLDKLTALLNGAMASGANAVNLEEGDCYEKPVTLASDASLLTKTSVLNQFSNITITYAMGAGVTVTLDKATTASWFSLGENNAPVFDRTQVEAWVNNLADEYDTIGKYLPFVTTNGETVYPLSRTYGWQMDRETEIEALYQLLLAGQSAERTPVWFESAGSRGANDIGSTYVEIDYTNQRMWFYKDGALLVETPVVTGNVSNNTASPEGVFCIVGKEEKAVLVGEDYKTPVDYWMPFIDGVGIHDADSWRTSYGGNIYQYSGSHGCINTPTAMAAKIYQNIDPGTPVVCYKSEINYGYPEEQVSAIAPQQPQNPGAGSSAEGLAPDGSIIILDGTQTSYSDQEMADGGYYDDGSGNWGDGSQGDWGNGGEDWADESAYYGTGENSASFPITTQDAITIY